MIRALFRRAPDPTHLDIRHGDAVFRVALRRAARARRFTLRVSAADGGVALTVPARADLAEAAAFAARQGAWIAARLAALPPSVEIGPGALVPLRGVAHPIVHRPGAPGGVAVEDGAIVVGGDAALVRRRVLDFWKREARRDLGAAVARHAAALGVRPAGITLRDTRSRWGSCTAAGRLNFSWRLVLAPPFVLDYLAAHEVAHLEVMDHSPAFWACLRGLCPGLDEAEGWLKRHAAALHRYR